MCGFDYQINYKKIWKANRYLRDNKDCIFMITNDDSTFPSANGDLHPGKLLLVYLVYRYCIRWYRGKLTKSQQQINL